MKKELFLRALLFILLIAKANLSIAQTNDSISDFNHVIALMKHMKVFQMTYPQEKAYLHFDNTAYFKGEHIYFKAYVVRTDKGQFTDLSSVLYVDLLNPSGDVIHKCKLKLENGQANGDIPLDSIYGNGFFEVRAYTRYMLNFGNQSAFSRVFPIFNKPEIPGDYSEPTLDFLAYHQRLPERELELDTLTTLDPVLQKRKNARGYHVNIYPEGGKLVKNIESKVAFTVTDNYDKPVALLGEVVDESGNSLCILESNDNGKGIFSIIPTSTNLTLNLTTNDKKLLRFDMPEVLEEGVVLSLDATNDEAVVAALFATKEMNGKFMAYTLMNEGNIYYSDTLSLKKSQMLAFKREQLKPGVNQLTFFDAKGHIHAERLFFICPDINSVDSIVVKNDNDLIKPCDKVTLNIKTSPGAHFSFSAMDANSLVNGKSGNIYTYMLLASDIQGYVPHPEYYFEADDQQHRIAADSLMLFNGWRRYDWKVMADVQPWKGALQPVEDQLYVYGFLKPSLNKWKKKNPIEGVDMSMYIFNSEGISLNGQTVTDSLGFYAFKIPDIYGNWNMQIITTIKNKLKSYEVLVDRQFNPTPRFIFQDETQRIDIPEDFTKFEADEDAFSRVEEQKMEMMRIADREYMTTPAIIRPKNYWRYTKSTWYDEYNGRLHANIFYDGTTITEEYRDLGKSEPPVYDWIVEHIKGMEGLVFVDYETNTISGDATYNGRSVIWVVDNHSIGVTGKYGAKYTQMFEPWKYSFNDDIYTRDKMMLIIPMFMNDVKSIYIWSDQDSPESAVVVYVYSFPYISTASRKGRRRTYFQGYDVPTKFSMDDYSIMPPVFDDYRRTLYWTPDVVADENGNAQIEFYNNSSCKQMYFSAEGFNADGEFISTK